MSAAPAATDLAMLLEERAIERVASEIDRFLDTKDWEGFRSCFADSIQVQIELIGGAGSVDMKAESFIRELQALNGPDRVSFHTRGNTLIDVSGDLATLRGHITAWNRRLGTEPGIEETLYEFGAEEALYEMWGSIEYGLRREAGHWRVNRVAVKKWRDSGRL